MRILGRRFATTALVTAACGGGARTQPETAPAPSSEVLSEVSSNASVAELEELYRERTASSLGRFTEADARFMTGMIAHHAQALVMAGLAPTHGASRPMQILTTRIINGQQDEIATMQRWLRDRGQPVPEIHIEGTTLELRGAGEHSMHMPGMLTAEQLRDLDQGSGLQFDRRFLIYMIQHHRGAVTMVDDLFSTDGAAQGMLAFKLASDIQADQTTEIARMELMLDALPDMDSDR